MEKYSVTFNKTKSQLQGQQAVKKTCTSKGAAAKLGPLHPLSFPPLPGEEVLIVSANDPTGSCKSQVCRRKKDDGSNSSSD